MIVVTKLDAGVYEIQEGISKPIYVSDLGFDTLSNKIVLTNKCSGGESKPYDPEDWTIICEGESIETGFTSNKEVAKALGRLCLGYGKVCDLEVTVDGNGGNVIYGSNLNIITSTDVFTTTSNTTVESVFSENTDPVEDGDYEIIVSYFWNGSNIRQDIETYFYINTQGVGLRNGLIHKQEPKDASGNWNGTQSLQEYVYEKTFYYTKDDGLASPLLIDLNFRTTGNNSRSSIWMPSIKIYRIR